MAWLRLVGLPRPRHSNDRSTNPAVRQQSVKIIRKATTLGVAALVSAMMAAGPALGHSVGNSAAGFTRGPRPAVTVLGPIVFAIFANPGLAAFFDERFESAPPQQRVRQPSVPLAISRPSMVSRHPAC